MKSLMRFIGTFMSAATVILLLCLMSACGREGKAGAADGRLTVTVSYAPQQWIISQIAGDDFSVNVLLPPGSDPETYDPTVAQLSRLQQSGVWLRLSTAGFEESMLANVRANFPDLKEADVSAGIPVLEHFHGEGHHHDADCDHHDHDCHENHSSHADPHVWSSVKNTEIIASNTLEQLVRLNPQAEQRYRANHRRLSRRLEALDSAITARMQRSGAKAFVMLHPSLGYFAHDYGLTQIAIEAEGKEPTPMQLRERIDDARAMNAHVMFIESEHNPDQGKELARQMGLRAVAVSLNSPDWESQIMKIAEALAPDK